MVKRTANKFLFILFCFSLFPSISNSSEVPQGKDHGSLGKNHTTTAKEFIDNFFLTMEKYHNKKQRLFYKGYFMSKNY